MPVESKTFACHPWTCCQSRASPAPPLEGFAPEGQTHPLPERPHHALRIACTRSASMTTGSVPGVPARRRSGATGSRGRSPPKSSRDRACDRTRSTGVDHVSGRSWSFAARRPIVEDSRHDVIAHVLGRIPVRSRPPRVSRRGPIYRFPARCYPCRASASGASRDAHSSRAGRVRGSSSGRRARA